MGALGQLVVGIDALRHQISKKKDPLALAAVLSYNHTAAGGAAAPRRMLLLRADHRGMLAALAGYLEVRLHGLSP
jgi:hypothetical protein